jgi:hypothetical protein
VIQKWINTLSVSAEFGLNPQEKFANFTLRTAKLGRFKERQMFL